MWVRRGWEREGTDLPITISTHSVGCGYVFNISTIQKNNTFIQLNKVLRFNLEKVINWKKSTSVLKKTGAYFVICSVFNDF